jgi:hypothetical protein
MIKMYEFTNVEGVDLINIKYFQPVKKRSSMCENWSVF